MGQVTWLSQFIRLYQLPPTLPGADDERRGGQTLVQPLIIR